MDKLTYNFIDPNTEDEMAEYLPKIIAGAIADWLKSGGGIAFLRGLGEVGEGR